MTERPDDSVSTPLAVHGCPLCGGDNQCAAARSGTFATPCWCASAKIDPRALERVPQEQRGRACLCPRCGAEAPPR